MSENQTILWKLDLMVKINLIVKIKSQGSSLKLNHFIIQLDEWKSNVFFKIKLDGGHEPHFVDRVATQEEASDGALSFSS